MPRLDGIPMESALNKNEKAISSSIPRMSSNESEIMKN
jgi:hypothetical protein